MWQNGEDKCDRSSILWIEIISYCRPPHGQVVFVDLIFFFFLMLYFPLIKAATHICLKLSVQTILTLQVKRIFRSRTINEFLIFFFGSTFKQSDLILSSQKKKSDLIPNCTTVLRVSHMDSSWVPAQHWIQTNAKIYINNKFHKNFPNLFTVVNSDFETQETKWKQS